MLPLKAGIHGYTIFMLSELEESPSARRRCGTASDHPQYPAPGPFTAVTLEKSLIR